jgi:hypothetical protein
MASQLNFDVSQIKWPIFVKNHACGIKKYILKEESYLPSLGYRDSRLMMFNPHKHQLLNPVSNKVFHKVVKTFEETSKIVFNTKWVLEEKTKLIQKRLKTLDKSKSFLDTGKSLYHDQVK